MAAGPGPDELLRSTDGKANFQRLTRLLIIGGTCLLREIFDNRCPPSHLPTILSNPTTRKLLKTAQLTKPQRDCLYVSPGVYGKSIDFDFILIFRLLRTICNLTPPTTGWDALPVSTDCSLTADLVRIKYYRNTVYSHVTQDMEITADEFPLLWQAISEALVRIAGQVSNTKKAEWQGAIDNFLKTTTEEVRGKVDYLQEGVQCLEKMVREEAQDINEVLKTRTQKGMDVMETVVREETQDIKGQLGEMHQSIERLSSSAAGSQSTGGMDMMETVVREETQDIKGQLGEMHQSIERLSSSAAGSQSTGGSSIPPEIRARGPRAVRAFQKAMQKGKVKVYRGRIMILGQERTGKTSLKKSLLGMPFDPQEKSTIGIEIDPSKCEVEVDQVKNWEPTEEKKLDESEFVEDIARLIATDLNEDQKIVSNIDESQMEQAFHENPPSLTTETTPDANQENSTEIDTPRDDVPESSSPEEQGIQMNIDTPTVVPKDVAELVERYLQDQKLQDDIKAKEVFLTLWDFAGQHLYYASHSVFLSARAIYVLVYNLSKRLSAQAEPCVRQGTCDRALDNPNNETNLDVLLSWLVSLHSIRPSAVEAGSDVDNQAANVPYFRPPVLIVGTNADQPIEDTKNMEKCIKESIVGKTYEKHVIGPFIAVDNTKSQMDDGVQKLRNKIMEVFQQEPYMGEEIPLRWFNFEKVVEAFVAKETYHMDLNQLLTVTRQVCHIDDEEELAAMLNFYHDLGVIVKHGRTVVLQAQWLINLFKQLITVKPFDEANALFRDCWLELERSGMLRMALVDHVFKDFIQKGVSKQDILNMMELYGLIAKFSCLSSESEQEQRYFVPAQLRSSPSGLCEIKPSQCDPCALFVHFLDGFVPHGLFPRLLSKCISWCSEQGVQEAPQLYHNGARFFIGMEAIFDLVLICRKRFIKVILKRRTTASALTCSSTAASTRMAGEVRTFLERTIQGLSHDLSWLHNLRYELCVSCTDCLQSSDQCDMHSSVCCTHDDCIHLLRVPPKRELICQKSFRDDTINVHGWEKWFPKAEVEEPKMEQLATEASAGLNPGAISGVASSVSAGAPSDQPLSLKSDTPSDDVLLLLASELGFSWKMLGRALGLSDPVLEQIEHDEHQLSDKCYGVLIKWRQTRGSAATYECLAQALKHSIVGRSELATKYCGVCKEASIDEKDDVHQWNSQNKAAGNAWGWKDAAVGVAVGTVTVAATPLVLSAAGFTATGVAAGSAAAAVQSSFYGASVASDTVFAALVNAGIAGIGATASAVIGGATGAAAMLLKKAGDRWHSRNKDKESLNDQ